MAPIVFKDFKIAIKEPQLNDTVTLRNSGYTIKVFLYDYRGKSLVQKLKNGLLLEKGNYNGSDSLYHKTVEVKVMDSKKTSKTLYYFRAPTRCGEWNKYDKTSKKYVHHKLKNACGL
jgi:hypothetical protein